jgi:hypothetical protein
MIIDLVDGVTDLNRADRHRFGRADATRTNVFDPEVPLTIPRLDLEWIPVVHFHKGQRKKLSPIVQPQ